MIITFTATPIGDPPNIIIVNDPRVTAYPEINFGSFTLHVAPGIFIVAIVIFVFLYFLNRVRDIEEKWKDGRKGGWFT